MNPSNAHLETPSNRPTHTLYLIKKGNGQEIWEKAGVAWAHKDGKGFNQLISFINWDIKLVMRQNT